MKKNLIVGIVVLIVFFSGCQTESSPIKIGYAAGITGKYSQLGVASMYGAELAIEEINAEGGIHGRELELIIKDDRSDAEIAREVDQELIDEGVVAIVGHTISSMIHTVPLMNENHMLMISPTIATDTLTGKDDYFIRVIPSNFDQAEKLAEGIFQDNQQHIAVLYEKNNSIFTKVLADFFLEIVESKERSVDHMVAFVSADELDYMGIASDIKEKDVDSLLILASAYDVAAFAQALHILECDVTIYIPAWGTTNDLLVYGGKTVENVTGVNFLDLESENPKYLAFSESYRKKYQMEPSFSAVFTYESIMILKEALLNVNEISSENIRTYILEQGKFGGLQSDIVFDAYGDVEREVYLYQVKDGKFTMKK
ncbi:ABC transporter substrate-binding protein [Gottschalkiaceae bacterium SANA]|nr:ABC transporter substrate-binding protein [Gottschalkiaceae bacterium SANA]